MSQHTRDNAGVICPPPLIYLGFLVAGLGIDYYRPYPLLPDSVQYAVGSALIVAALALNVPALRRFLRAGTAINPAKTTTVLVTDGPYRFTRKPLHVALACFYAGIAVAADSIWALALLLPLVMIVQYGVVLREERYLEGKFGEDYLRYKASVRRWV